MTVLPLGRAIVGSGHVTASVFLFIAFLSTGHWVPGVLAVTAGTFAWWLLKEEAPGSTPCGREKRLWCEEYGQRICVSEEDPS